MTKRALVTGGASGIGLAIVELLLANGVDVAVLDRDKAALSAMVAHLECSPGRLVAIEADLTQLHQLPDVFSTAVERLGHVDFLINSAALTGGTLDVMDVDADEMARAFLLNVTVPLLLMQMFSRHVIKRGVNGRIVNLSSSSAYRARSTRAAYGASKAALSALTRIASAQLGVHDINVNAVAPGLTRTPALAKAMPHTEDQLKMMVTEGPNANFMGRVSEPKDVASVVVFLCSEGARQITGQTLQVSAGTICL